MAGMSRRVLMMLATCFSSCLQPARAQISVTCGSCTFHVDSGGVLSRTLSDDCTGCYTLPSELENKGISSIDPGTFTGITSLWIISLKSNQLETLPQGLFDGLSSLSILDLSNNRITSITTDFFHNVTILDSLDLSYNQLTTLPQGVFNGLPSLRRLDLSYNQFSDLPAIIGILPITLQFLGLDGSHLSSIPAGIKNFSAMNSLSLKNNQLTSIPDNFFESMTSLSRNVDLSYNQLTILPTSIGSLVSLGYLNLSHNSLTNIQDGFFDKMTNIVSLDLSYNKLSVISAATFTGLTSHSPYTRLYISKNDISCIDPHAFDSLAASSIIDIRNNSASLCIHSSWPSSVLKDSFLQNCSSDNITSRLAPCHPIAAPPATLFSAPALLAFTPASRLSASTLASSALRDPSSPPRARRSVQPAPPRALARSGSTGGRAAAQQTERAQTARTRCRERRSTWGLGIRTMATGARGRAWEDTS
eukprot:196302-Hanusia_phi.AAC.2